MAPELDVEIGDSADGDLPDCPPVDQVLHRDQHAVNEHRVIGRQQQIAAWQPGTEGTGGDTHRAYMRRLRMVAAVDVAVSGPDDWFASIAWHGPHTVTDGQSLHGHLTVVG